MTKEANSLVLLAKSPRLWILLAIPVSGYILSRVRVQLFVSEPAMNLVVSCQIRIVEIHDGFVTWVEHSPT